MQKINSFSGKYYFLSNFYTYPMVYEGIQYQNAEAAFQGQKCQNETLRAKKYSTLTPNLAKREGRREKLPEGWDNITTKIMHDILLVKFSIPELRESLLATGDAELEEGNNWHDNNWGNCTCPRCKDIEGKNRLGKMLMQVREELKKDL